MTKSIDQVLNWLDERLEQGARQYRNRSFRRKVHEIEREVHEGLIDEVGWLYVLWSNAAARAGNDESEPDRRALFLEQVRHRWLRNDRGRPDLEPGENAFACMVDIEILAVDLLEHAEHVKRRLHTVARSLEVARWLSPMRGRRGGVPTDPRQTD